MVPNRGRKEKMKVFEKQYIAHRGLFDNESEAPENSIPAFQRAVQQGYGIELDVQLTTDNRLVVFHDETLQRMCGFDKKLTECSYDELKHYRLAKSDEKIPLFDEVLKVIDGKVPLIVEVKSEGDWKKTTQLMAEKQRRIDEAEALRPEKEGLQERIAKSQAALAALQKRAEETNTALRQKQGEYSLLQAQLGNLTAAVLTEKCTALQKEISLAEKKESDLQETLQQTREKKEHFLALRKQAEQESQAAAKTEQGAEAEFFAVLREKSFANQTEYEAYLTERTVLERAEEENRQFFAALEKQKQLAEMLAESCAKKERKDVFALEEERKTLLTEHAAKRQMADETRKQAAVLANLLQNARKEWQERMHAAAAYLPIRELSRTANGELPGKEKIAFEQFVQGVYFRRILQAANLRLQDMTEGRYLLLHAEKAMNRRSQAGLELEVLDHYTGKSRSVRSLSGGEAFKASLSLALGLSDVIQAHAGGVRVDAMFIDEGFGSLDEQSREQAVQVLQRLSYGNRLVGIISHVSELKESIDKKIIVKKGSAGSSIAWQE